MRVLLVDNDAHTRDGLGELLREDGFVVDSVRSGEAALDLIGRSSFDVVVAEVRLPGMNGVELTRAIRARRPIPVVAMAASDVWRQRLSSAGAASFHTKPVSYSALVSCLDRIAGPGPVVAGCLHDDCPCVGAGSTQAAHRAVVCDALRQSPPLDD